jgi:hypothetical protein
MGRRSREKGKRWERDVARLYRETVGEGKRTGWHQSHGLEVADVSVPLPLPGWPKGIWNECKHHARVSMRAAMNQALDACPDGHLPVAVCKDDRKEPLVVLRLEDWLALLERLASAKQPSKGEENQDA